MYNYNNKLNKLKNTDNKKLNNKKIYNYNNNINNLIKNKFIFYEKNINTTKFEKIIFNFLESKKKLTNKYF